MLVLKDITDPVYKEQQFTSADKFFLRFIRDERDLPFIYLTLKITFTILPLGFLLYMPFIHGIWWAVIAIAFHYFNNFAFKGPFGLMLHCTSHRIFFKKEYNYLNYYLPWIIAPFFGHSPDTYYTHHVGMHHAENNLEDDKSTTMPYQRDSLRGFLHYFISFLVVGIYNLATYHFKKHRTRLMYKTIRGEILFIVGSVGLSLINWQATLVVFIIPYFLYRLIAFLGNWAQHAFVCAKEPGNSYRNSVTCINTNYNHKCWNDGYHISHHIKPAMHWTEHPTFFKKTVEEYATNDAIVFDGIHFLHIFIYLMQKRYDLLAAHFVNLGNRYSSDEEVIVLLKSRTKRIEFK